MGKLDTLRSFFAPLLTVECGAMNREIDEIAREIVTLRANGQPLTEAELEERTARLAATWFDNNCGKRRYALAEGRDLLIVERRKHGPAPGTS